MKERNPWFVAIISLITLGIYKIYWLIVTKEEMNQRNARIPSIFIMFIPLLGLLLVAALQMLVNLTIMSNDSGHTSAIATISNIFSVLVGLASLLALIPAVLYWFYKYSKGVELVTDKRTSTNFCFWWGIVSSIVSLDFIWAGVIQNRFNKQVTK